MNSIIENNELNLSNLFFFILIVIKKYFKALLILLFIFCLYLFLRAPAYSSSVSFYTNYDQTSKIPSSLGFISSLAGGQSNDSLGFSVSDYINSDNFFNFVLEHDYVINGSSVSLVEHLGKNYNKIFSLNPISILSNINRNLNLSNNLSEYDKKLSYAKEKLQSEISHNEDQETFLHTISFIAVNDSELSKQVVEKMFESIISYSNEITNIKGAEKEAFIESRLLDVKKELNDSENELLLFLENNKAIDSPSLILQRERLERKILLHNQLFISLSDQLEIAKIDAKDNTSSVFLLDAPSTSAYKPGRGFLEKIFLITIIFLTPALTYEFYINRDKLYP